ncbi:hypothetical protein F511_40137 [Dorcoceras hygrometricum]|uniref:Uncharacterized protein n=1 Tax=Dorcoceras hygrometricum TaxID=472368 RepID=A0A2Z7A7J2_9LAMI|nr:hypothetical protein F511_40137 [Dorcoceras hygrometricum]
MHPRLVKYNAVALDWISLLIADVTADFIIADPALALLFTTADCDDITADVIIADSRSCASSQLLILDFFQSAILTSSLLLAASSSRHADVIIAESRFLFASIQQLLFTEPYLIRFLVVDSSDKSENGSVGLLLMRRFVWISFSNVFLKLVRWWICVARTQFVVIVAQRIELLHLHTRIILLSSVFLAMHVLLIGEYQDAVFEDERVVPVYLGGNLLAGFDSRSERKYQDAVFEDERVVPVYLGGNLLAGFDSRSERSG